MSRLPRTWQDFLAQLAASETPVMRPRPMSRKRLWEAPLGPVYVPPNQTATATHQSSFFFRVENLIASDSQSGFGTLISAISVGQKNQMPVGATRGVPTFVHAPSALSRRGHAHGQDGGYRLLWDTAQPAMTITVQITDIGVTPGGSTWSGALFGTKVDDGEW